MFTTSITAGRLCAVLATAALVFLIPACSRGPSQIAAESAGDDRQPAGLFATANFVAAKQTEPSQPRSSDWPNWRGHGTRAVVHGARLPARWPKGRLEPLWQYELGTGFSSPVVSEGRVFITDRLDDKERVLAIEAKSGKLLWQATNPIDFDPHAVGRRHGNGPKSTPAVAGGRVFALGIAGMLQALDVTSGQVLWSVNLPREFGRTRPLPGGRAFVNGTRNVIVPVGDALGAPAPLFGYTGSPAVVDDRLILEVGGRRGATVMALDQRTGEVIWRALEENVSYSSPVVGELAGTRQVVAMTGPRVVGLSLEDGRLLWSHPFQSVYDESVGTPAVGDDLVVVTAVGRPLTALRITRDGESITKHLAWENHDLSSYTSSMLIYEGHVYGMNDDGEFGCVRLADGKTMWLDGNHGFNCSPVAADGKLLGLADSGELFVLEATPSAYRLLATLEVADRQTWTVPAVVGGRMFVRSAGRLAGFEFRLD